MYNKVSIDFETRSEVDLIKTGAYRYATDPSTGIYCLAYAFDNDDPQVWVFGDVFPKDLEEHVRNKRAVHAFNAEFELLIWNHVLRHHYIGLSELEVNQIFCTAAQGRVNSLPASLKNQARALGTRIGKSDVGMDLIKKYSVNNIPWANIPVEDQDKFLEYCKDDVIVERLVSSCLRELSPAEWDDYHNVVYMNLRGIQVDIEFAQAAVELAVEVRQDVVASLTALTRGRVSSITARNERDAWLLPKLTTEQKEAITVNGSLKFDKARRAILSAFPDLNDKARRYLELVDEAGGSTLAKYEAMLRSHVGGRIYGAFSFNSATTGRASSKLVQLQNMKRPIYSDEEATELIDLVVARHPIKAPAATLAYLVRPTIYLDKGMTVMDYSSVEYIVLAWIAGNEKAMKNYINDVDAYKILAAEIFNRNIANISKDQRQAAKIVMLAAGFGGGKGAVQSMAVAYGVKFSDAVAQNLIDGYRKNHPNEVKLWSDIKDATQKAVRNPKEPFTAGKCEFESDGDNLWIKLPSGRFLRYIQPKYEYVDPPWDGEPIPAVTYKNTKVTPAARSPWPRTTLNHIVATENICQAIANDLLREALRECEREDLEPFMMVHDEIVVPGKKVSALKKIMQRTPWWAEGLPLKAEGEFRYCYGK